MNGLSRFSKNWIIVVAYASLLVVLFFFLGLHEVFFSGPQGLHFMRQTDSLSFASQYFNEGFDFFNPKLYNLRDIDGRAACEFPIVYYTTAIFYAIFGENVVFLKLFHLLILYIGVYYVFKLALLILNDYIFAVLISIFLFTSTVFNYYSFNYLPDAAALGFIFIGWYFIFKYQKDTHSRSLLKSVVFFTLGGLIKVTYLISPLTVLCYVVYAILFKKKGFGNREINIRILKYGSIGLVLAIGWNVYMLYYNAYYESNSFNTSARPIWDLSKSQMNEIWWYISYYWNRVYLYPSSFHILFSLLAFQLIFFKKGSKQLLFIVFILLIGSLAYLSLFYSQFQDHDYYFLAFMPLIILVLINGIQTFKNVVNKRTVHIILQLALLIIIIAGTNYSRMKLSSRNHPEVNEYSKTGLLIQDNLEEIEKLQLPSTSKFVVLPDLCPNGGLYFLNKQGWTIGSTEIVTEELLEGYKDKGADYLLLATEENHIKEISEKYGELIFKGEGISIYNLNPNK